MQRETTSLSTFFFIDDIRLRISSISGSTALGEVAQICWFGQPSQAVDLPASAEVVPGQCSGASVGTLLMEETSSSIPSTHPFHAGEGAGAALQP